MRRRERQARIKRQRRSEVRQQSDLLMLLLCCRAAQLCTHEQVKVFIAAINELQVGGLCLVPLARRLCVHGNAGRK